MHVQTDRWTPYKTFLAHATAEVLKLWGVPMGALFVLSGARVIYMRDIYFGRSMGAR
jgi:hypothetical protein